MSNRPRYITSYEWYPMSAKLHKILVLGNEIIRYSLLPVEMVTQEASEAKNKYFKNDRLRHSRQVSRCLTLADIFYRTIDSTDPLISSTNSDKTFHNQKHLKVSPELVYLIEIFDPVTTQVNSEEAVDYVSKYKSEKE